MVEQIFLSPQVKRSVIISNKLDYTRCLTSCQTRTLGSLETSVKSQNSIESSPNAQPHPQNENAASTTSKNLPKSRN